LSELILRKEEREDIASISDAGARLAHQIEDIQDYSEIQRKNVILENERYMITSVLVDLIGKFRAVSVRTGLDYIVDLDPAVPAVLKGDAGKITKIMEHLLNNAFKFTRLGGARLRIYAMKKEYGINLIIEVSDTGKGMTQRDIEGVSKGIYQADKKRDRSTGGIGLGLSIVYGLVRSMNGFVKIESVPGKGTTVRVSVFQEVVDNSPCMSIKTDRFINAVFYNQPVKYKVPVLGEYYRDMARTLAKGLRVNLYLAQGRAELEKLISRGDMTHIIMGAEEYLTDKEYIDAVSSGDVAVAVSATKELSGLIDKNSVLLPKPFCGMQIVSLINGEYHEEDPKRESEINRPILDGIKALVCDDEPMNLVVATGLFREYNMYVETAESGREAIEKFSGNGYDVVFMDHMMPEMDGIEAMKRIRAVSEQQKKEVKIIALTANAVSGAKEMFLREGFDGFISKPITINDFERVMNRVMKDVTDDRKRGTT
jgi:CheY-like chemotaxis protein